MFLGQDPKGIMDWAASPSSTSSRTTYRSARWQSNVFTYAPDLTNPIDVWVIGELFATRERIAELSNRPIDVDESYGDLLTWLAHKPWIHSEVYVKSIRAGAIPKLKNQIVFSSVNTAWAIFMSTLDLRNKSMRENECNFRLPSEQYQDALNAGKPVALELMDGIANQVIKLGLTFNRKEVQAK